MAQSYMLTIYDGAGRVHAQERRTFAQVHPADIQNAGGALEFGGTVSDHVALLLVNSWNQKAIEQAMAQGASVRFAYYL